MAVNLYFASKEVLRSLKGVGDKTADKIIKLRKRGENLTVEKLAEVTQITCEQWEDFLDEGLIIIDRTEAMMSRMVDLLTARSEAVQVKQGSSKQERNSSGNSCSGKDFSKISGQIEKLHEGYQLKAQHMKEHLQDKIKQSIRRCEEESWEEYTQMTEEYRGQIRELEEQRRQEGEEEGILFSPPKFRSMGSREFISKVCKSMPMDNVYRGQQVHEMRHESQGEGSQLCMGGNPLLEGMVVIVGMSRRVVKLLS